MNTFENNLNLLKKHNTLLAERIQNHTAFKSQFSLEESMSGDVNLKRNNQFLHDKVDPEQEAINLLNEVENKGSAGFNFIYGLGLGYLLKRFCKTIDGYIIVYEPDLDVLRLTFEMVDFTDELSSDKVFIFDNLNDIDIFYEKYFFYEYTISTSIQQTYREFNFDNAKEFITHLGYIHGIYLSNYQTYWDKHHSWVNSLVSNIPYVHQYNEVKVLKDKFKNKPAVIISAGPSLDKTIDLISKNQDKFVIFCVGTALKTVIKHGIKPDFICFVEYLPVTARMLDEIDLPDTNIVLQASTCKDIFMASVKNKFMFYADNDEVSKWLAGKFGIDVSDYINRGTVSVNALVSAKIMGCNPIILTGQDLAYTNNQCYASGSIYDNYVLEDKKVVVNNVSDLHERTKIPEENIRRRAENLTKKLYEVKGQNGETLLSPGDYASFIKYFEDIAVSYSKDTKLINSSPGGAQINGYENIDFQQILNIYAKCSIDKTVELYNNVTADFKNILKSEITKTVDIFDKKYQQIFNDASALCVNYTDILLKADTNKKDEIYLTCLSLLLPFYRNLRTLPRTDLLELLISRNTFFIDFYIKNFEFKQHKIFLGKILYALFKTDYEKFILPVVKKLKTTEL